MGLDENKEEEQVEVMELDQDEEEESIMDMGFEIEQEEETNDDDDDDDDDDGSDVYKNLELLPQVTYWFDPVTRKPNRGIKAMDVGLSTTDSKFYNFDVCPICLEPWTHDKIHQLCCLPCGHMFGMSCLKDWMEGRSRDTCPECYKFFSFESVRLLYANLLCIPSAADRKASFRHFPFNKKGFTTFKQYERELRTNALNNMSETLKQRADILGRRDDAMKRLNDAIKRRTRLLELMAKAEKRANVLKRHNDAAKRKTGSLNPMTDEEEWASQRQTYVEKRAEGLRRRADTLGQRADEYRRKADVFGQQAKALLQKAKSLRQLIVSYKASKTFYIQSYKEFLGLRDNKTTE